MKQLSDKELATLGAIGYLLEEDEEKWLLIREKIIEFGFQDQVNGFQQRMFQDIEKLEVNINNLLVAVATDMLEDGCYTKL